ncbi:MAG: alpha-glucan family phosphorylase [Gemmatimonadota bacterium]|nr:alpha-glucan family phosphorylase [Gemmatimonadota bacterium]MDH3369090.1 alpha-glucan family phosphorylase [Gemmatimonadota bacterium]MDH3478178.1 alpha-glucan family phosphorylase [Gemmatimonadota bacterium]MDH3571277.1 alpha-glucan family phosphorylase [Gemmatimonadota bacterium]MDH5550086.1 alpha-glucan family phosphorylase [Gemmatimonadota bacterium]
MTDGEPRIPHLPDRIGGLAHIATNLWWSWSREARQLFRSIDELLWQRTRHNPILFLQLVDPSRLVARAQDPEFLEAYDRVVANLDGALSGRDTWFRRAYPDLASRPVAYFCAEFGLHNSVPIYSGGLGVLAGDHCKAASDLGVPLVGIGLLYTKGYFDQRIRLDGWQEDADDPLDPTITPLAPVLDKTGHPYLATIPVGDRTLHVGAWRMMVGSVSILLLDTNLEVNDPQDRSLSLKLYAGGPEMRLRQEWVLGVGGVRLLRRLGVDPGAWHANEGHAAFMLVERVREQTAAGTPLQDAIAAVRATSVFTTHTPVPAGHDVFTRDQIASCIGPFIDDSGLDRDQFYGFGWHPGHDHGTYHMTVTGIRLSGRVNGVSELHGQETRRLWRVLWPEREPSGVPITHVTNGVHLATWMAHPMMDLLDRHLGVGWGSQLDDPTVWDRVLALDDAQFWRVHLEVKDRLLEYVREDARRRWRDRWKEPAHLMSAGTLLGRDALTVGFARRFATYKRADLIFRNPDRLRQILVDPRRPVQIVFAGKAHPADEPGKRMLQTVYNAAHDPSFEGRIAFLEDYEMHLAHRLVQGVDLWLNLPRVPMEACGTSGMKAALNGVPQLGTLDGWWAEGYNGRNGWAIPLGAKDSQDEHDAEHVYELLETEIIPLYFERDSRDVPTGWMERMRHTLREALKRFTARAMVQRYTAEHYLRAMRAEPPSTDPPTA